MIRLDYSAFFCVLVLTFFASFVSSQTTEDFNSSSCIQDNDLVSPEIGNESDLNFSSIESSSSVNGSNSEVNVSENLTETFCTTNEVNASPASSEVYSGGRSSRNHNGGASGNFSNSTNTTGSDSRPLIETGGLENATENSSEAPRLSNFSYFNFSFLDLLNSSALMTGKSLEIVDDSVSWQLGLIFVTGLLIGIWAWAILRKGA